MSSTGISRIDGIDPWVGLKAPATTVSLTNITLSGEQTVNGVSLTETTPKKRVLANGQDDPTENGLYDVYATAWRRSDDMNGTRDVSEGTLVYVQQGTTYPDTWWRLTTTGTIVFGTSNISFSLFGSAASSGNPNYTNLPAAQADTTLSVLIGTSTKITVKYYDAANSILINADYDVVAAGTGTHDGFEYISDDGTAGGSVFQLKLRIPDIITFKLAGADKSAADNSTVMQTVIDWVAANGPGEIRWRGAYTYTTALELKYGVSLIGEGGFSSKLIADGCNGINVSFTSTWGQSTLLGFWLQGTNSTAKYGIVNQTSDDDADELYGFTMENCLISDFNVGFHGRHFRNLTISNNWIQDVNSGIELVGKNFVCFIEKNHIIKAAGNGTGTSNGILIDSYDFTDGTGIVPCEGIQIHNNESNGFDYGINSNFANYINETNNDVSAKIQGIKFSTVPLGFNCEKNFIVGDNTNATQGIFGAGLASVGDGMPNIIGNIIQGASTTSFVGIQINESGNSNQNHVNIIRNLMTDCDTADILVYNSGPMNIENNRCFSSSPTNSINIATTITLAPVYIDKNHCVGAISAVAADVAAGYVILGNNVTGGTTQVFGNTTVPTVASAATIALPLGARLIRISGTTTITTITSTGWEGKTVTLLFEGTCQVTDGSNLNLATNFSATSGDTLTLAADSDWYEVSRSDNG